MGRGRQTERDRERESERERERERRERGGEGEGEGEGDGEERKRERKREAHGHAGASVRSCINIRGHENVRTTGVHACWHTSALHQRLIMWQLLGCPGFRIDKCYAMLCYFTLCHVYLAEY